MATMRHLLDDFGLSRWPAAALLLTALAGCGGGETGPAPPPPPPPPPTPASIAITAGDEQEAAAGTAVAVAPAVVVRNVQGQPLAGVSVQFAVVEGGGTVTGGQATSDAGGVARVGGWTLGESGDQRLTANAGSLAAVAFRATLTPGTETITSTIGPAGGVVQITAEGHPLQGLAVTVPAGTFAVPGAIAIRIAAGATPPSLPAGYRVAGPVLEVHTAERRGSRLMTVEMPVTRESNEDIVLVLHDPVRGVTEVLPTVARGATSVTAMTTHLRADLLLGPEAGSVLRAGAAESLPIGETGWLMPVAFPLPQPEVSLAFDRWPVLDYGSARSPNGFGPAIPVLSALNAARKLPAFSGRIKPLATPGFYAEAAPMAVASMVQTKLVPKLQSVVGDLRVILEQIAKPDRDEMLHRNLVASMALSTEPTVVALLPGTEGGEVLYANGVAGSETAIGVVHPGLGGVATMARSAVSGYASMSIPPTPDRPEVPVESAAPLGSMLVAFEDISSHLQDLTRTLDLAVHSAERNLRNSLLAAAAGLTQPVLEVEAAPGRGWHLPGSGPIPIRNKSTRLRSTGNDPASVAVHEESGEVVVMAEAAPVETEAIVTAQPEGQPITYVVSGVERSGDQLRQTAPVEAELAWVPFEVVPDHFPLKFGAAEVTFDAAVPFPPEGGYRIRWEWGDDNTTEVVNAIRGVHEYEEAKDRNVIATLLPATGETVLAADTVRVSAGQPFWRITSFTDADEFYDDPVEPDGMDDLLYRIMTRPEIGLIGLVEVPGGRQLRLYARASGAWDPADCCPPTIVPADESMLLGQSPESYHDDLGPFWSAWRYSNLLGSDVSNGSWSGHAIGPKHSYVIKDAGTQLGTEYAIELTMTADGTALRGILRITIWHMNEDREVEPDSEQTFRFLFNGVRLR